MESNFSGKYWKRKSRVYMARQDWLSEIDKNQKPLTDLDMELAGQARAGGKLGLSTIC